MRADHSERLSTRAPTITVVGSIAFDSVMTPVGPRERMLGGSAVHFAFAAAAFSPVCVVGRVGDDFLPDHFAALEARGVTTDQIVRVAGMCTFFWRGVYADDFSAAETVDRMSSPLEREPIRISPAASDCDVLFLANTHPNLQRATRRRCPRARIVALDSREIWIRAERYALCELISEVDLVLMTEDEVRLITGRARLSDCASALLELGPQALVVKQGADGATLFSTEGELRFPACPPSEVVDPTGAGDCFAGGFLGFLASTGGCVSDESALRAAMCYGLVSASFSLEAFGTERVAAVNRGEIDRRLSHCSAPGLFRCDPAGRQFL
jgi:sugar/nucleoside kinase (ribokinase family)